MDRFGKIIAEMAIDGYRTPSWFSFKGRLRRRDFLLRTLIVMLGFAALAGVCFWLAHPEGWGAFGASFRAHMPLSLLMIPFVGLLFWLEASAMTLRFHDLGFSAWMFLVLLIPVLDVFIVLMLFLGAGDMPNRFGWPPPSNRRQSLPGK